MGALIHLAVPVPAGQDAGRVYYGVGRSVTAADFAQQGRYNEARLLGLTTGTMGVIAGLGISPARFDSPNGISGAASLTIGVGSGIGADGRVVRVTTPISIAWTDLVAAVTNSGPLANGWYFLLIRTAVFDGLEGPAPDPSQRAANDPMLDIRQDSFVEVWLSSSVGALPATRTGPALALALNTLIGGLTPAALSTAVGNGVPIAIVLVLNGQAILLSQAAGRLPAEASGLNAMLLGQMSEEFTMALAEAGANPALATWQTSIRARFRFLPGAGELPVGMLLAPEAVNASCPFFPQGMGVYLELIRASQASHLLYAALGRSQVDLASNDAEAVTLTLAIPDAAWTPDLLDIPRGDPVLAADTHLAYAVARTAQIAQRENWIAVYGGMITVVAAQSQALGFLMAADTAARNISYLLTLPPPPAPALPMLTVAGLLAAADNAASPLSLLPTVAAWVTALRQTPPPAGLGIPSVPSTDAPTAAQQIAALGYQVVDPEPAQADPNAATHAPVASDTVLAPLKQYLPAHSDFSTWSTVISAATANPVLLQPLIDAGILDANATAAAQAAAIAALLQPLIDAGILDANATATAQAAAIAALLKLPAQGDPANDDTQPGALLQLATLQLFYGVFVRVARAYESYLDAHSRLIALQRQHLDIMSTSVSALAGGVPSDGSGLSFTRLIPFVTFSAVVPPPTPAAVDAAAPAVTTSGTAIMAARTFSPVLSTTLVTSGAALSQTNLGAISNLPTATQLQISPTQVQFNPVVTGGVLNKSLVSSAPITGFTVAAPSASIISSVLGNQTDVAQSVAQQIGAISQAPTFQYTPVKYGAASYVDGSATALTTAIAGVSNLRTIMNNPPFNIPASGLKPIATGSTSDPNTNYGNIVLTTSGLLDDINKVENNALQIEGAYLAFRDRIVALEARIAQVTNALANGRDTLRSSQATATQTAGDYAATQQLVVEETARVNAAMAARHQAITAATGLFYVRELQTLITQDLPPSMSLTADTPNELVPGCPTDHAGPPASIQPFLDLLLEVPLANWRPLLDGWTYLPDPIGIQRLGAIRATRLASWTFASNFGSSAAASDLASLANTTRSAFSPVFSSAIPISASLAATQQAAFSVFSLPDIVALPVSILRTNAEAMRARLESATGCLFETLTAMPPSARFAWASLARAGTLPTLQFAQWPVPAGLGDASAAAVRRLAVLVDWMAGQLHDGSSAASQTALGNLVAAAVMAAAYGDPNEAVTGTVASSGGVPQPGVPIRVLLNRLTPIGTTLDLFDANQSAIGTLRVQDHDASGTTATVVSTTATTAPTSGWTVASRDARAPWLPS
jgi:hypothetical protein